MTARAGAIVRRRPEDDITPLQYKRGWELVSTWHTTQQVLGATGLTRPQLAWLMKVGDEARGMPSYQALLAEQQAEIRGRAKDAAALVGASALEVLEEAVEVTKLGQRTAKAILYAHLKLRVQPTLKKIEDGTGTDDDLADLAMPKHLRETLRDIRPYTDFRVVAETFHIVFDSPHQTANPLSQLPKGVRLSLAGAFEGEAVLPAAVALVEELSEASVGHDLLDDLIPEYRGWSVEEIDHYVETGERPARDYGETPLVIDAEAEPAPELVSEPEPTPEV